MCMVSKEILIQYSDLQQECKEVREKIEKLEKQIEKIESDGAVIDKVRGGDGGLQSFKIEGFPYPEYSRKKTLLYARKATLSELEMELLETLNDVEIFNIVLRSVDYTYTLSDLITSCHNGYDFVLRRLNNMSNEKQEKKEIPELLQQYVYMAAGAYAWLTRWEYEAKPMKEPKSESNNYADRLFAQVDDAITKYLSNIENNRNEEYICMDLFYVSKAKW